MGNKEAENYAIDIILGTLFPDVEMSQVYTIYTEPSRYDVPNVDLDNEKVVRALNNFELRWIAWLKASARQLADEARVSKDLLHSSQKLYLNHMASDLLWNSIRLETGMGMDLGFRYTENGIVLVSYNEKQGDPNKDFVEKLLGSLMN